MATAPTGTIEELLGGMSLVSAPAEQRAEIEALSKLLGGVAHGQTQSALGFRLLGPQGESIALPDAVLSVLELCAGLFARGDAVTVAPVGAELSTEQAADLLNVSRPYLVGLLDDGRIPFTTVGEHRRLRLEDVMAYKSARDRERDAALTELTRLSEELGGYQELR